MAIIPTSVEFEFVSERLGFSIWSPEISPLAVLLWGNLETTKFIGGPWTAEQISDRLQTEMDNCDKFGFQYWPIFLINNGHFVGCCGLRPYDLSKNILEVGVHLLPEAWGQGLAKEALQRVIRKAFDELGAAALFAGHNPHNCNSRKILLQLGFQFQSCQFYPPTGLEHPSYLLSRTSVEDVSECDN